MTAKKTFSLTTPIFYVNAKPHLGHAYTSSIADSMVRFQRLMGKETFFITGTDEHGDKIAQAAEKQGVTPKQLAAEISAIFQETMPRLGVQFSRFVRTTS